MSNDEFAQPGRAPRQLQDVLSKVLKRMKVSDTTSSLGLFSNWREVVGDTIADHVTPKRLEKRILVVEVDDPAWATQLKFLEAQLISTLREKAGDEVDSLDVKVRRSR